jgi:uncharacterized protein YbjQ (UPF0145 family)
VLFTTTPVLPGRTYREVALVVGGSPLCNGSSNSNVGNAYNAAGRLLAEQAIFFGCNAVIGIHVVMGDGLYILMTGTAIQLEDEPFPTQEVQQEERPQERWFRPWMAETWDFLTDRLNDL